MRNAEQTLRFWFAYSDCEITLLAFHRKIDYAIHGMIKKLMLEYWFHVKHNGLYKEVSRETSPTRDLKCTTITRQQEVMWDFAM